MKAFLGSQDIWEIVVSGPTKWYQFVSNWEETIGIVKENDTKPCPSTSRFGWFDLWEGEQCVQNERSLGNFSKFSPSCKQGEKGANLQHKFESFSNYTQGCWLMLPSMHAINYASMDGVRKRAQQPNEQVLF